MNARTQIAMNPELQRRAHAKAAELGVSFAEYVRRLVAHDLGEAKRSDISLLFGLGWEEHRKAISGSGTPPARQTVAERR